ncbi:prostate androgen-regulated mucin-like protein 1 [Notamacropus eugenii]|uniref:prostate androgen-regulated mucin-like protein 1 n=1 Tax=Notamacropus eugenii TaxID=9315 RepID=UPI003B6771EC
MVCYTLFTLLVFATGLRVQSLPVSTTFPVSLPTKFTTLASISTSPPQNTVDVTNSASNSTQNNSLFTVTLSAETTPLSRNISVTPRDPESTSKVSRQESTVTAADQEGKDKAQNQSLASILPTSSQDQFKTTHVVFSTVTPEVRNDTETPTTVSPPPSDKEAITSPEPLVSSSSSPSLLPPKVSPTSVITDSITTESTTHQKSSERPLATPTPTPPGAELPPKETPTLPPSSGPMIEETTSQVTTSAYAVEGTDGNTASPRIIMQQVQHALSSGSVVAITVTVIAVILLVFGVAAYLKIRHSSYGRLLDDHDYGSWGNYNNPLYDDS